MNTKLRIAVLGSALALLMGVFGGTTYAAQPPVSINTVFNKVVEVYNYLVNTINPKLNSILSSLTMIEQTI